MTPEVCLHFLTRMIVNESVRRSKLKATESRIKSFLPKPQAQRPLGKPVPVNTRHRV